MDFEPQELFPAMPPDGLSALARTGAAREHGHAGLAADRERRHHVLDTARDDYADRFDLIDRGIGGVTAAIGGAEQHLALDFTP
jgi:hypothetical protein